MIGQTLGHYRIVEKIGEGGMGVVYRARDERLERDVALKVLPASMLTDAAALKSFRKEAHALSKLSHPNIATVHDFDTQDGVSFLVMEYIPGMTLDQKLAAGPLSEKEVARLGVQLAQGLRAAHDEGLVHRDLKPSNVRITPDGRLKILDFGLAKLLRPSYLDETQSVTEPDHVAGTLPYMSPEQLQRESADERSDIYSAGAVLYEMITARRPFPETYVPLLVDSILHQRPQPPSSLNRKISPELENVISKALDKNPELRYQSAKELQIDLERLGAVNAGGQIGPVRRHRLERGAALGVLFLLVAMTAAVPKTKEWARQMLYHLFFEHDSLPVGVPSEESGKYLAVLPFGYEGDVSRLQPLADGLSEELSVKLRVLGELSVASSRAARTYIDLKASADKIASQLRVNLIVRGNIQATGETLLIVVDLQRIDTNRKTTRKRFTGKISELLGMENQICQWLVRELALKTTAEELDSLFVYPTESTDAYDAYLRGQRAVRQHPDIEGITTALGYYERALEKDPHYALAYAAVADASVQMYTETNDPYWANRALEAARRAVIENDKLPEAHMALGNVYLTRGLTLDAIKELKAALELSPKNYEALLRLGQIYLSAGDKEDAMKYYQNARTVNPTWLSWNELGLALVHFGEYQKALDAFQEVINIIPNSALGHENKGFAFLSEGNYEESIPELEEALTTEQSSDVYSNLGVAYLYEGRYADAIEQLKKALEKDPDDETAMGYLADAYSWAGNEKLARENYEHAVHLAQQRLEVNARDADLYGDLALYFAKTGDTAKAEYHIGRARELDRADVNLMFEEAEVFALTNQPAKALKSLRYALQNHVPLARARRQPELKELRERSDFKSLLAEFK